MTAPICPYCHKQSKLIIRSSFQIYSCFDCAAWVGVHKGTTKALGTLADLPLRRLRIAAHTALDPLWQAKMKRDKVTKKKARHAAYAWLAGEMGIDVKDCHVAQFDIKQCEQVVGICSPYLKTREKE